MAITIIQQPNKISPAYNPLLFLIRSTDFAQPNFRFIAVVKVGATIIAKKKFTTMPGVDEGWIDLHRTIESLVAYDFDINSITLDALSNSFSQYSVEFGVEYGTTVTEYLNQTATGDKFAFNFALDLDEEFLNYDQSLYISDALGSTGIWLRAMKNKTIGLDQRDFGAFLFNSTSVKSNAISVIATKANGTTVTSTFTIAPTSAVGFYAVPTGPENLNLVNPLATGTVGQVIPSDCVSYTVRQSSAGVPFGETLNYKIDLLCSRYTKHDLFFLNRFGHFESFRFNARSDTFVNAERAEMETPLITSDGVTVGYNNLSQAKQNYSTRMNKRMTLNSDFLNRGEYLGLTDLRLSPVVFMYTDGKLKPITIKNNDWREPLEANDHIENIKLEIEFSVPSRRQSL
jgi:hypothetical protein